MSDTAGDDARPLSPAEARTLWPLQPGIVYLNHGSYGATPRPVLEDQDRWRARMEAQPCRFFNDAAPAAIREAATALAGFLGAPGQDLVLVENATAGVNAVLRSLDLAPGDEILVTDHVYNAVRQTLRVLLAARGARLVEAPVGLPVAGAEALRDAVLSRVTGATRLVLIDHVASVSAAIFPVAGIAAGARALGVPVLVDGAHAPGMLDLDIPALGVDWYVGNAHKWLCAPKGAAFLWTAPERQAGTHPTVISHDAGEGYTAEFDWVGTRDLSAWLSVPAAIRFHDRLGGPALRARNRRLAVACAEALADRWGTATGAPPEAFGSMATVRLPVAGHADKATAAALRDRLWHRHRTEVQIAPHAGALWLRLSVPAYIGEAECLSVGPLIEAAVQDLGLPRAS